MALAYSVTGAMLMAGRCLSSQYFLGLTEDETQQAVAELDPHLISATLQASRSMKILSVELLQVLEKMLHQWPSTVVSWSSCC